MVAFSGGGDSTGLLLSLYEEIGRNGANDITLTAATVDHRLREESAVEAAACGALCARLGINHQVLPWIDEKPTNGVMDAARLARYRLLDAAAVQAGADMVVIGHTLDDQAETVTMRKQRTQSNMRGLAGIAEATLYRGRTWFVRPILNVSRADIRAYLQGAGASWFDDPSNSNPAYERVRVRNSETEADFDRLTTWRGERLVQSQTAAEILLKSATSPCPGYFQIEATALRSAASQLAVSCLAAVAGGQSFLAGQSVTSRVFDDLASGRTQTANFSRAIIEHRGDILHIYREKRDIPELTLVPGQSGLWDERFELLNGAATPIEISETGALAVPWLDNLETVPRGIAGRVRASAPHFDTEPEDKVQISTHLGLFDFILPSFDLALARAMLQLTGRKDYPAFPLGSASGK